MMNMEISHDYIDQEEWLDQHGMGDWETGLLYYCTNVKITNADGETVGYVWWHHIDAAENTVCVVHGCMSDKRGWSRRQLRFCRDTMMDEGFTHCIAEIHRPVLKKLWKAIGADVSGDALAVLQLNQMKE